jgi:PTS system cellobiose-specific IIC component
LGKLAIVPSFFGINEPVVFGLPCMLNVTLAIPFIFTPVLLIAISYVLTIIGILPIGNGVGAPAAIPFVAGLFNGGWKLAVWQLIEIVLTVLIYLPFFKRIDREAVEEEQKSTAE